MWKERYQSKFARKNGSAFEGARKALLVGGVGMNGKSIPCTAQVAGHTSDKSHTTTDVWDFNYHTSC